MKKTVLILPVLLLTLLTGCKFLQDWLKKEKPEELELISKNITKITDAENFKDEVLKSDKLTLVKFEADWCGSCKKMAPIYEKAASTFEKIKFTTVDTDDLSDLAKEYGIRGIPTFIFFKDGKIIRKLEGEIKEEEFVQKIKDQIKE